MKATECRLVEMFKGTKQFVVPGFHRDYSWTKENCERLWEDVIAIAGAPDERRHFLGTLNQGS